MSTVIRFALATLAAISFALTSTGASAAPAGDQPGGYTTCPQWQDCSPDPDPEPEDGPDDFAPCPEGGCQNPDDDNPEDGGEEPEDGDVPDDGEPQDGGEDPAEPVPGGSEADVASVDDDVVVVQPNFTG